MIAWSSLLFMLMVFAGTSRLGWLAAVLVLVTSPISMAVVNRLERGTLRHLFNLRIASWTFVLGDIVGLPWVAYHAAEAQPHTPGGFFASIGWLVIALAIGIAGGFGYDKMASEDTTDLQKGSRSRHLHHYSLYPVLLGSMVYLLWPVIWAMVDDTASPTMVHHFWLATIGVGFWSVLMVLDTLVHKPKAADMHPEGEYWPTS